eukprot:358763-Chlamydomonas_euryale.AAC.3
MWSFLATLLPRGPAAAALHGVNHASRRAALDISLLSGGSLWKAPACGPKAPEGLCCGHAHLACA